MAFPAPYDPRVVYVARRHITVAGKEYKQGERVPRDGVSERDYHMMFARRKIVLPYDDAPSAPAASSAPNGNTDTASSAETKKEEVRIDAPEGGLVPGAKGWFAVWHGGKFIRNVRGEAAANTLLAELRGEATEPEDAPAVTPSETPQDADGAKLAEFDTSGALASDADNNEAVEYDNTSWIEDDGDGCEVEHKEDDNGGDVAEEQTEGVAA